METRGDLGRRLHSGPLQAFFAAALALEQSDPDHDRAVRIIREGASQLAAIIDEIEAEDGASSVE